GNAIAALHGAVFDEGLLQRMQHIASTEPLDGHHATPLALHGKQDARVHRRAVEQHRAHPTFGFQTILLGPRHAEAMAQYLKQRPMRLEGEVVRLAVDGECEPHTIPPRIAWAQRDRARSTITATS